MRGNRSISVPGRPVPSGTPAFCSCEKLPNRAYELYFYFQLTFCHRVIWPDNFIYLCRTFGSINCYKFFLDTFKGEVFTLGFARSLSKTSSKSIPNNLSLPFTVFDNCTAYLI